MIKEGQRQFIPREEGDRELTQSEVVANTESRVLRALRGAGVAAVIGAALLNAESAKAQETQEWSSVEKQKIEQVRQQFSDEYYCKLLLEATAAHQPELEPILSGALVREVDAGKAGTFGERDYYVYLPTYELVLVVPFNNFENESKSDPEDDQSKKRDEGIQKFIGGLLRGLTKNGLIEIQKDPSGKVKIVTHYRNQGGAKEVRNPEFRPR